MASRVGRPVTGQSGACCQGGGCTPGRKGQVSRSPRALLLGTGPGSRAALASRRLSLRVLRAVGLASCVPSHRQKQEAGPGLPSPG